MYKAVIFDFFGVIRSDPYQAWLDKRGLKREGVFLDVVRGLDRGMVSVEDFLQTLSAEVNEAPEAILQEINRGAVINDEVVSLIHELRGSYSVGLLSNTAMRIIEPLLQDHDITQLFDVMVVSSEVGYIKPEPEIFDIALERLQVTSNEAIFIDDSQNNVDAAISVGIEGLLFTGVVQLREDLAELHIL